MFCVSDDVIYTFSKPPHPNIQIYARAHTYPCCKPSSKPSTSSPSRFRTPSRSTAQAKVRIIRKWVRGVAKSNLTLADSHYVMCTSSKISYTHRCFYVQRSQMPRKARREEGILLAAKVSAVSLYWATASSTQTLNQCTRDNAVKRVTYAHKLF